MADFTTPLPAIVISANAHVRINELFDATSPAVLYGRNAATSSGRIWGYFGGRYNSIAVSNGTITLPASSTSYLVADKTTGVVSSATNTTLWNNTAGYERLYQVVTNATAVTDWQDHRQLMGGGSGSGGFTNPMTAVGDMIIGTTAGAALRLPAGSDGQVLTVVSGSPAWAAAPPVAVNNQTLTAYTLVLADGGRKVRMNNAATNTATVPPNSSVAFPVGTVIAFRQVGAGQTVVAAGSGVTLNIPTNYTAQTGRQGGEMMIHKVGTDEWDVTGDLKSI